MTALVPDPSAALAEYLPAFAPELLDEVFVTYYAIGGDKVLVPTSYTRREFWNLGCKAASLLASRGVGR